MEYFLGGRGGSNLSILMMTTKIREANVIGMLMTRNQWLSETVSKKAPNVTKNEYIEKKKTQQICSIAIPMNPKRQKMRFMDRKTIQVFLMHSTCPGVRSCLT